MAFNIKNVLTEDELRITKKMRDNGAYDWTRKRKSGEEDYSLSMDKVVKGLEKGMTRQEIADELCKRKGQILYMEDLLMERLEHPTLTKKEQASRNIRRDLHVMSRWTLMNKDASAYKSHDFKKIRRILTRLETNALVKEGKKNGKVA